jgi:hypothetical protein
MKTHQDPQDATSIAPFAVYTILHYEKLKEMADSGKAISLYEKKRWVTALKLFSEARKNGMAMAVLFADATYCAKLLYWGRLELLEVDGEGSRYTVAGLTALSRKRTQSLVLRSSNLCIAEGFIRPYAIVETPSFIRDALPGYVADRSRVLNPKRVEHEVGTNDGASKTSDLTLFSFGYWGCGSATPALVEAIDQAESGRGFEPPLWVDIRISRSVRAAGFRDRQFADLLKSRYVWMPELGNRCVAESRKGIEIKNPAAAKALLQLALNRPSRRVIFFCSCEHPTSCHRKVVGKLALKEARAQKERVTVIEWPGGEPGAVTIDVLPATLRQIERGMNKSIPIPPTMTWGDAAALPWGTIATVRAGKEHVKVLVGPASFNAAGTHLRVFSEEPGTRVNARSFRSELGFSRLK